MKSGSKYKSGLLSRVVWRRRHLPAKWTSTKRRRTVKLTSTLLGPTISRRGSHLSCAYHSSATLPAPVVICPMGALTAGVAKPTDYARYPRPGIYRLGGETENRLREWWPKDDTHEVTFSSRRLRRPENYKRSLIGRPVNRSSLPVQFRNRAIVHTRRHRSTPRSLFIIVCVWRYLTAACRIVDVLSFFDPSLAIRKRQMGSYAYPVAVASLASTGARAPSSFQNSGHYAAAVSLTVKISKITKETNVLGQGRPVRALGDA